MPPQKNNNKDLSGKSLLVIVVLIYNFYFILFPKLCQSFLTGAGFFKYEISETNDLSFAEVP